MTENRELVIRDLMRVASDAMSTYVETNQDITANEVMSAYLTLGRAAIIAAKKLGTSSRALQQAVQQLLLDCLDDTTIRQ